MCVRVSVRAEQADRRSTSEGFATEGGEGGREAEGKVGGRGNEKVGYEDEKERTDIMGRDKK